MEIFLERKDARTRHKYSVGVGKGGLPSLGTGLLYPLTKRQKIFNINMTHVTIRERKRERFYLKRNI